MPAVMRKGRTLPNGSATVLAMVAALLCSLLVAGACGMLVVWLWFADARSYGLAAFIVGFFAAGIFANPVVFAAIVTRHHVPSPVTFLIPVVPWFILGVLQTWSTCKEFFITWDNWRWIIKSSDSRVEWLNWIFTGWLAMGLSALAGLLVSRGLINRVKSRPTAAAVAG